VATIITLCLLIGATGKSAQIPLHVWLPDAMAGPTPVSALIHAATMVTAGIYMIVRSNALFALAPGTSQLVATVGALTALFAATIAVAQSDIKRVLAYSTISQLGFMVAAAGLGAYAAAMFHLVAHAFFKALLFLSAGSVILGIEHASSPVASPVGLERIVLPMEGARKRRTPSVARSLTRRTCTTWAGWPGACRSPTSSS
jgi:NADH-quinone oxidoreductase subunit L